MSEINTGGPAFPFNWETKGEFWAMGMSLRDYFAAKAMQGLMTRQDGAGFDFARAPDDAKRVALWAYDLADAMLKAREG